MSSHWAATHGIALVLSYKEMDEIVETYCQKYPNTELAQKKQDEKDYFSLYEDDFFELANGIMFSVTDVNTDYADGMYFIPFKCQDGSFNTLDKCETDDYVSYAWREPGVYALFSEHAMDSAEAFIQNPYTTYEDLVQEFKNKLIGLVPDDFNWDAHIGRFSYATYG